MASLRRSTVNPGWPELRLAAWRGTLETVHRWLQIVGKLRLSMTPLINHWWNVTLYVTPRGAGADLARWPRAELERA